MWPAQVRHLPNTAVYALDLPGHGASPGPSASDISAYSELVRDFVDALELPWFLLAGHSMGGAIALDFALAYAYRLAAIMVVGSGARMRVAPQLLEGVVHDFEAPRKSCICVTCARVIPTCCTVISWPATTLMSSIGSQR
jgi:pimeloyl-ACP methyl ester carboxylesterase